MLDAEIKNLSEALQEFNIIHDPLKLPKTVCVWEENERQYQGATLPFFSFINLPCSFQLEKDHVDLVVNISDLLFVLDLQNRDDEENETATTIVSLGKVNSRIEEENRRIFNLASSKARTFSLKITYRNLNIFSPGQGTMKATIQQFDKIGFVPKDPSLYDQREGVISPLYSPSRQDVMRPEGQRSGLSRPSTTFHLPPRHIRRPSPDPSDGREETPPPASRRETPPPDNHTPAPPRNTTSNQNVETPRRSNLERRADNFRQQMNDFYSNNTNNNIYQPPASSRSNQTGRQRGNSGPVTSPAGRLRRDTTDSDDGRNNSSRSKKTVYYSPQQTMTNESAKTDKELAMEEELRKMKDQLNKFQSQYRIMEIALKEYETGSKQSQGQASSIATSSTPATNLGEALSALGHLGTETSAIQNDLQPDEIVIEDPPPFRRADSSLLTKTLDRIDKNYTNPFTSGDSSDNEISIRNPKDVIKNLRSDVKEILTKMNSKEYITVQKGLQDALAWQNKQPFITYPQDEHPVLLDNLVSMIIKTTEILKDDSIPMVVREDAAHIGKTLYQFWKKEDVKYDHMITRTAEKRKAAFVATVTDAGIDTMTPRQLEQSSEHLRSGENDDDISPDKS